MAAQLEVKCVSCAGKGSKGWPLTPAPVHPDLGLYPASPGFEGTGRGTRAAGSGHKT